MEGEQVSENRLHCTRGCVRRRRHLSDCEDRDDCRGCEPRLAEYGLLCWPCHRRMQLMLSQAEIHENWLTGNLPAGTTQGGMRQDYESRGTKPAPPAPIKLAILDIRQLLGDRLATWADYLVTERSLTGPTQHSVKADSKFLLAWLGELEKLDWIGDMFEELADTLSDAHALAPWRPEANRLRGIPCPDCNEKSLFIFGGEEDVTCTACHGMMTPARYGIWTRMLAEENGVTA